MFSEIRKRLTLLYAAMMGFILLTFVTLCLLGATYLWAYELDQDICMLAREEADEQLVIYKHRGNLAMAPEESTGKLDNGGQMFYYVFDTQGQLMNSVAPVPVLRQKVFENVTNWRLSEGETVRLRFELPDGHHRMIIMTARSIVDGQEMLGTVYVGKDISAHYRMLRKIYISLIGLALLFLFFAAAAAYFMAGRAMIPIRQSFMRQKQFVADASHELRTPLSVLLTSADAIAGDKENRLTEFSHQVVIDMKDEIRKMSKIVGDLLTLARADAGVTELVSANFDLRPEAERVIRGLQPMAEAKGIKLTLHSPGPVLIRADRERLNQLMLILLDNALKYTARGGFVDFHVEPVEIENRNLVLRVVDTGVGIAPEHQTRIFERFYRVDKVRSRQAGGTGLGLAIAEWIVKKHGGTITVSSELDKGTTFTVTIPLQK